MNQADSTAPPLPLTQLSPDPASPSTLIWSPTETPNLSTIVTPTLGFPRASSVFLQEIQGAVPQRGWFDKALGTTPLVSLTPPHCSSCRAWYISTDMKYQYFEFVSSQDCNKARAECIRLLRAIGAVVQMEDAEGWGHLKVSVSEVKGESLALLRHYRIGVCTLLTPAIDVTGIVIKKSARLKFGFIPKQHRTTPKSPNPRMMASPRSFGTVTSKSAGLHSIITMTHERGSADAFLAVYGRLKTMYGYVALTALSSTPPPHLSPLREDC